MYDSWFCPSKFLQGNDIYIDNLPMHCVKPDSTNLCVLVVTILTMLKCNISFWIDNTTQCCFYFSTFSSISWNQGCVNLHGLWWQPLPQCKEAKPVQNQVPLAVLMPQMPMPPSGSIFFVLYWYGRLLLCNVQLYWEFLNLIIGGHFYLCPWITWFPHLGQEVVAILCGRKINYGETAYRFITIMWNEHITAGGTCLLARVKLESLTWSWCWKFSWFILGLNQDYSSSGRRRVPVNCNCVILFVPV
jgi:hypothetical protein